MTIQKLQIFIRIHLELRRWEGKLQILAGAKLEDY